MRKYLTILAFVLILFASLIGCTEKSDQQIVEVSDGAKAVFFEVANEGNTVYLLGSIHVGKSDMYPLQGKIEEAYASSSHLAVEVNINDISELEMIQHISELGLYLDGSTLKDHIDSDLYDELLALLNEYGMQENEVSIFKPWLVTQMVEAILAEQQGYSTDLGIDQYFLTKAAEDEKKIISLETVEEQLNLLAMLSADSQEKLLHSSVFEQAENEAMINDLVTKWIDGDIAGLAELRKIDEDEPEDYLEFYNAFTDERDKKMAQKIDGFLQNESSETYFVVVGALHLVGENSIVDVLKSKGYDVKMIFTNK
ncbi:TraB/GumN family protein [Bacillaceae bacterium IKA-2]|nr:TraB/GumN family protein [Bacillaceae bacterium IKA-2]